MNLRAAYVGYFALAIACAVILATRVAPFPLDVIILLAIGLVAREIRRQLPGGGASAVLVAQWLGCFAAVWLVLAFALGSPPF